MYKKITIVCFSPTKGTRTCASTLASFLSETYEIIDLCDQACPSFSNTDIVLFAMPVYAGRIPKVIYEKMKHCQGQGAKAISMIVYGNRAYEDALLELNMLLEAKQFSTFASIAAIAQHSIIKEVGYGRPDTKDIETLQLFAQTILAHQHDLGNIEVPGTYPFVTKTPIPVYPITDEATCTSCMACIQDCPMQAIDQSYHINEDACISCMRCVNVCPSGARKVDATIYDMMRQKLSLCMEHRCAYELYLAKGV